MDRIGPGDSFIAARSPVKGIRGGEWYIPQIGWHDTFESWEATGRPTLLEEARERVERILATHQPLPLDEDVERELDRIQKRAQMEA